MINYIITAASLIVVSIYTLAMISYYKKFVPFRAHHRITVALMLLVNMAAIMAARYLALKSWIVISGVFVLVLMEAFCLFKTDLYTYLYGITSICLSILLFYTVVCAIFSFALRLPLYTTYRDYFTVLSVFSFSLCSAYITVFHPKFISVEKERHLAKIKSQEQFVIICRMLILIIILLVQQQEYIYPVDVSWFPVLNAVVSVAGAAMVIIITRYAANVYALAEYETRSHTLEEQLRVQLLHYKSYQKYTDSFRAFRHDYKNILLSVRGLIKREEYEELIKLMVGIHDTLQRNVESHKQYSNNLILDAILQDCANTCAEDGIRFSAVAHIPDDADLDELEICRVFSNIMDNAIEACRKVEGGKRFIELTSETQGTWATVEIRNSFDGVLKTEKGRILTTKPDSGYHGVGLRIIWEIMEKAGGFMKTEADVEQNIFTVKIHFPLGKQAERGLARG